MRNPSHALISVRVSLVLIALALVTVACGGSADTPAPTERPSADAATPAATSSDEPVESLGLAELTPVTIYVGGITSSAPQDWAAQAQGFFAKYNLEPEFVILEGTSQAVQAVAADARGVAYTQGSLLDVMLVGANSPDAPPLVGLASMAPLNPVALLYMEDSGIASPEDLVGKTIGVPTGSLSETYLNIFLEQEGIAPESVTIQNIGFGALHPALLQGQVDAIAEFARGIASMSVVAEEEDRSVGYFLFGDYDIPSPLTAVVVQKGLVEENPAAAQAIAAATSEALHFCVIDPEQCIRDFVDLNEGRDYDQTLAEWMLALEAQYGMDAESVRELDPLQLGWFDPELVADAVPELSEVFGVEGDIDPTTLYTNEFVRER